MAVGCDPFLIDPDRIQQVLSALFREQYGLEVTVELTKQSEGK